jgi:hypothetical protein
MKEKKVEYYWYLPLHHCMVEKFIFLVFLLIYEYITFTSFG